MTLCDTGANLYREHVETGTASAELAWRRHLRSCPVCMGLKSIHQVQHVRTEGNVTVYKIIAHSQTQG